MEPVLCHTAAAVFPRNGTPCKVSTQLLSRFLFVLGQVAIQHLVSYAVHCHWPFSLNFEILRVLRVRFSGFVGGGGVFWGLGLRIE